MAARPIITGLKTLTTSSLSIPTSNVLRSLTHPATTLFYKPHLVSPIHPSLLSRSRQFHNTAVALVSAHGEGDRNDHLEEEDLFKRPPPPIDATHSAYLGEADSHDGHEAAKDIDGEPQPSLDASGSAYLGEADSDDAFEGEKEIIGDTHKPLDASHSAYLGEGDSNDFHEGEKEVVGDQHEPLDPNISGFHGEAGHMDEPDDVVWSDENMTLSEADIRADQGKSKIAAVADKVGMRVDRLQTEVDDLKTIMGDREGVERDKFRL